MIAIAHMTTMIAEVYDALLAAGAPEEKARRAAEAIAGYEDRFIAIDQHFAQVDQHFVKVEGDLNLVKWMLGFNLATSAGIILMLLRD